MSFTSNSGIIEIKTSRGLKYLSINRVMFIEAKDKGSIIHLDNKEQIKTKYLLKKYSGVLEPPCFFRCHNSFIVNCCFIDCFCKGEIILNDNTRIPFSRNKTQLLKENLISYHLTLNH
jgi:two-component system, LytTR family, response regulator